LPTPSSPSGRATPNGSTGTAGARRIIRVRRKRIAEDAVTLPDRPITRPPLIAKGVARAKLAATLEEDLGHDPVVAQAMARAIANPQAARALLAARQVLRVPGAELYAITTPLWTPAVLPSPVNPRGAGNRWFPAATSNDPAARKIRPPLVRALSAKGGLPHLGLEVEDPDHLADALGQSINSLMETAEALEESIPLQGVMKPVVAVPVVISHRDGTPDLVVVMTAEGSTRAAIARREIGFDDPTDAYKTADDGQLERLVRKWRRLTESPEASVTAKDKAMLRVATIPAEVIIGFRPDPGSGVTFADAIDSWVAGIHIDPPRHWPGSSDLDTKASAVVGSFARQASWDSSYIDYISGLLNPAEATAAGFWPSPDQRAVEILARLGDDAMKQILNDGLRQLATRNIKPRRDERLKPLVELMMRGLRTIPRTELDVARTILGSRLIEMSEWNATGWRPTHKTPAELAKAAKGELAKAGASETVADDGGEPVGMATRELAFLALFWLARWGSLRRQVRSTDPGADNREPSQVLREMMHSDYGIDVLAHIVTESRSGRRPMALDRDGSPVVDATGVAIGISLDWLRTAFPTPDGKQGDPTRRPNFARALREMDRSVAGVATALRSLEAIQDGNGNSVVKVQGISFGKVTELRAELDRIATKLAIYGVTWQEHHTPDQLDEFGDFQQDDPDADDEGPDEAYEDYDEPAEAEESA